MKKLVIAVAALLVVALGFAAYQAQRPHLSLSERIKAWDQASERGDKISLATTFFTEPTARDAEFDPDSALEVSKVVSYLQSELIDFERSLPAEVRHEISSSIKGARKNRSHYSNNFASRCPDHQLQEIEAALGLEVIVEHGVDIAILAGLYEDILMPEYYRRLADYSESSACKDPDCKAFAKVYRQLGAVLQQGVGLLKERVAEFEELLSGLGKPAEIVPEYAARWPECLGQLNMELSEAVLQRLTVFRARYLISEYRRLGVQTEEDLDGASPEIDPENPLKREMLDGWGESFHTTIVDNKIVVISNGPDLVPETADDLKFEE